MKSPLIFRVFKDDQIHVVKQFLDKDQVLFGHEAEVDIDLDAEDISSIHCLIEKRGTQFFICDLGSSTGTYKNGQPILDEAIASGDEFKIGPFRIIFFIGAPKPMHSPRTSELNLVRSNEGNVIGASVIDAKPSLQSGTMVSKAMVSKSNNLHLVISNQKRRSKKGVKTFAPTSEFKDLRDYLRPGKGRLVEVIVAWQERIINTYHFVPIGLKRIGRNQDIDIPDGAAPKDWTFLDFTSGAPRVKSTIEMKVEIQNHSEIRRSDEATHVLRQDEALFVSLPNKIQLVVRYAPAAPPVPFESAAILSSSELTGILAALIIAALTSLIVSVTVPKAIVKDEEVQRVAQVIFDKPPIPVAKPAVAQAPIQPPKEEVVPPPPPPPPKPETLKKITITDEKKQTQVKGDPAKPVLQNTQAAEKAGRASEVKPNASTKFSKKQFTSSVKQGGAIKTGNQAGANAKSKDPDPTQMGLAAAFGSGGARSKLDKAYAGSGQALGQGEKANGASGFSENRAGDDLGGKFKNVGAGGKGVATQGIADIGTKGRGSLTNLGNETDFGKKDQVAIESGGKEEEFVGSIDPAAVRRAVKSGIPAFKACFDREYRRNSKLTGKVVITWEIHERGVAKNARVVKEKSTLGNTAVEECVRTRMLTLQFPEPPEGTVAEVTYPFVFTAQR